jgi:transcriptional regulator with XRE-family HTH domain
LALSEDYDQRLVRPDGLAVRRRRHDRSWSRRELIDAVGSACLQSTGLRETVTPNQLSGIEEHDEVVPYRVLCLLAGGLDCDPVDLLLENEPRIPVRA